MDDVFLGGFSCLEAPRVERTKKHRLLDSIALPICGLLSGAQSWQAVADFGVEHQHWFEQFLALPNGIPSHDTINRRFSTLFCRL